MKLATFFGPDLKDFRRIMAVFLLAIGGCLGMAVSRAIHTRPQVPHVQNACRWGAHCPCKARRPRALQAPQLARSF